MLDLAGRRWPEVEDRRELLLRLVKVGRDLITKELSDVSLAEHRERLEAERARQRETLLQRQGRKR
jgi:hypothetical protein